MEETNTDSDSTHSSGSTGKKASMFSKHELPKPLKRKTEDETIERKVMSTPKRKRTEEPVMSGTSGTRKVAPLSERQQMALVMQLSAQESGGMSPQQAGGLSNVQTPRSALERKVNKRNEKGESPLHLAAIRGDLQQLKILIRAGADVNVQDFAGWTALHEACNHGFVQAARLLLRKGACVNAQGLDNDTPLHDASMNGHPELVCLLMKYGANALQPNSHGRTPLDVALNEDISKLLRGEISLSFPSCEDSDSEETVTKSLSSPDSQLSREEAASAYLPRVDMYSTEGSSLGSLVDRLVETYTRGHIVGSTPSTSASTVTATGLVSTAGLVTTASSVSVLPYYVSEDNPANSAFSEQNRSVKCANIKHEESPFESGRSARLSLDFQPLTVCCEQNQGTGNPKEKMAEVELANTDDKETSSHPLQDAVTLQQQSCVTSDAVLDDTDASAARLVIERESLDKAFKLGKLTMAAAGRSGDSVIARLSELTSQGASRDTMPKDSLSTEAVQAGNLKRAPSPCDFERRSSPIRNKKGALTLPDRNVIPEKPTTTTPTSTTSAEKSLPQVGKLPLLAVRQWSDEKPEPPKSESRPTTTDSFSKGSSDCKEEEKVGVPVLPAYQTNVSGLLPETKPTRTRTGSINRKKKTTQQSDQAEGDNSCDSTDSQPSQRLSRTRALRATVQPPESCDAEQTVSIRETRRKAVIKDKIPETKGLASSEKPRDRGTPKVPPLTIKIPGKSPMSRDLPHGDLPYIVLQDREKERAAALFKEQGSELMHGDESSATFNHKDSIHLLTSSASGMTTTVTTVSGVSTRRTLRSHTNQTRSQHHAEKPNEEQVPPRKRKRMKPEPAPTHTIASAPVLVPTGPGGLYNPHVIFKELRIQMQKKWERMGSLISKPPRQYDEFLMRTKSYLLSTNSATHANTIAQLPPPASVTGPMRELFIKQEQERYKLRLQHYVEKDKLILATEQENVRAHNRGARALANQDTPLSVCSVLKDQDSTTVYHPYQMRHVSDAAGITDDKEKSGNRSHFNNRQLLSWLQDLRDKFEKIKEQLLSRHHHEADSLYAVQMMDWEWKLKECGQCDYKTTPVIDKQHVPMVEVSDDIDLLPT